MKSVYVGEQAFQPSKLLCIGRNYVAHIQELNNVLPDKMVVFHKPNSSITNQLISFHEEPLHYETEICFLLNNGELYAVGLGLDLTKRTLQSQLKAKGLPWERAKAFDQSAVLSRFIPLQGIDITTLSLELLINCVRVQCGAVRDMLYPPLTIVDELQRYVSLEDGDIVMTGTPQGVGPIARGDIFLARLKSAETTLLEVEWHAQ